MLLPATAADLLRDQRIRRALVGNSQQCLRQAHQDDALLRRQPIFVHEGVDTAVPVTAGPRRAYQPAGKIGDPAALVSRADGALGKPTQEPPFIHQMVGGNLVPAGLRQLRHGVGDWRLGGRAHPALHALNPTSANLALAAF